MKLFGFEITRQKKKDNKSFTTPQNDDNALVVKDSYSFSSQAVDIDGSFRSEEQKIRKYREISYFPEVDKALDEIINEAVVQYEQDELIKIDTNDLDLADSIKEAIEDEFNTILELFDYKKKSYDMFRDWYVDGRIYYHVILHPKTSDGIAEFRYVDPSKIKKVVEVKTNNDEFGNEIIIDSKEYYVFNDNGISTSNGNGVTIYPDSIIDVSSGIFDRNLNMSLSNLNKAIKPANQLRMIEDSLVVYRIARAPERRVFYIDVGNLPKTQAEQYVANIMNKYRNKLVYDADTGEIRDNKRYNSILDDFWMPRREGGGGTQVDLLAGAQNIGELEDLKYFREKLLLAMNVPIGRIDPQQTFSLGRSTEITREEVKFFKFIMRLRNRFSDIFLSALRVQLIAKGIMSVNDWDNYENGIRIVFGSDNYFSELKSNEIMSSRIDMLDRVDPLVGSYYSRAWVRKNVLKLTDNDIIEMQKEIEDEKKNSEDDDEEDNDF